MRGRKRMLAFCMAAVIAVMPMTAPRSFAAQGEDLFFGGNRTEPEASAVWQEPASDGMMAETLSEELTQKLLSEADLVISTAEELLQFAEDVTKGNSYEGKTVRLAADIMFDGTTLNNMDPVGAVTGLRKWGGEFNGTFDGMGRSISGIVQTERNHKHTGGEYLGLFYRVGETGTVKNLTVKNSTFRIEKEHGAWLPKEAGAIAARNYGEIRNCRVEDCTVVCCSSRRNCYDDIGGIAGLNIGTINACTVTGTAVGGHFKLGGIAGSNCGTILNCCSAANVEADEMSPSDPEIDHLGSNAGGIAGRNGSFDPEGVEDFEGFIFNCANVGTVSIRSDNTYYDCAGGIAGSADISRLSNCYSSGAVKKSGKGTGYTGGVAGAVISTSVELSSCYYSKAGAKKAYGYVKFDPEEKKVSSLTDARLKSREFLAVLNQKCEAKTEWTLWQFTDESPYPFHTGIYDIETVSGHGEVSCQNRYAGEGRAVSFTVTPEESYSVTDVCVVTASGRKIDVEEGESGYAFTMPGERVCIVVSYGSGSIADCSISLSKTEFVYNGKEKTPAVSVKDAGTDLKEGTDYEVSYASNTNAGTGIVTVAGKGDYTGTAQLSFAIAKASQKITLSASSCTVTDGAKAFSVKAKASKGGEIIYSSSDQSVAAVSQKGRVTVKGPGLAVITVKAPETENYAECTRKVTVTVEPKQVKLTKLTPQDGKKLKAEWKALQNVSGYLVEYSLKKNFKDAETVTVKGSGKTSAVLKGLTAGKTYYVRVTAYKEGIQDGEAKQIKGKPGEALRSGKIK